MGLQTPDAVARRLAHHSSRSRATSTVCARSTRPMPPSRPPTCSAPPPSISTKRAAPSACSERGNETTRSAAPGWGRPDDLVLRAVRRRLAERSARQGRPRVSHRRDARRRGDREALARRDPRRALPARRELRRARRPRAHDAHGAHAPRQRRRVSRAVHGRVPAPRIHGQRLRARAQRRDQRSREYAALLVRRGARQSGAARLRVSRHALRAPERGHGRRDCIDHTRRRPRRSTAAHFTVGNALLGIGGGYSDSGGRATPSRRPAACRRGGAPDAPPIEPVRARTAARVLLIDEARRRCVDQLRLSASTCVAASATSTRCGSRTRGSASTATQSSHLYERDPRDCAA